VNRKQIASVVVGILVGYIGGFFTAKALDGGPTQPLGQQASAEGMPENHPSPEAMERIRQLTEKARSDPNDREARVQLGNSFYDIGQFNSAIPWYEEAFALDGSDVLVSTDLGTCYLYLGNFDKAMEYYQKSLELSPNHPQTMQNMGIGYFSKGDYQKAIETWESLLQAQPNYEHADEVKKQISSARLHLSNPGTSGK